MEDCAEDGANLLISRPVPATLIPRRTCNLESPPARANGHQSLRHSPRSARDLSVDALRPHAPSSRFANALPQHGATLLLALVTTQYRLLLISHRPDQLPPYPWPANYLTCSLTIVSASVVSRLLPDPLPSYASPRLTTPISLPGPSSPAAASPALATDHHLNLLPYSTLCCEFNSPIFDLRASDNARKLPHSVF